MNSYSTAILNNLNKNSQPSQPSGRLSESRLAMRAINILPPELELEVTADEAKKGTSRSLEVNDSHGCPICTGMKPINKLQCQKCRGLGYIPSKRRVEINLEAGLIDGQKITYQNLGSFDFRTGKNKDLLIKIKTENKAVKEASRVLELANTRNNQNAVGFAY